MSDRRRWEWERERGSDAVDADELDWRLRRALGPRQAPGAVRQRLRYQLLEHEAEEVKRVRRNSRFELGAVAVVLLVVVAMSLWRFELFGGEGGESRQTAVGAAPTETAAVAIMDPTATADTAVAYSPDCDVTPTMDEDRLPNDTNHNDWYAGDGIWLSPASINGVNPSLPDGPALWYTGGLHVVAMWPDAAEQPLRLAGKRIDGEAGKDPATLRFNFHPNRYMDQFLITFPEPGCWELTASAAAHEMTIVIDVWPIEMRPDMAQVLEMHELLPYQPPSACGVSPWRGPQDEAGRFMPYYWLDGEGVSARSHTGIIWAFEPLPLDLFLDEWGPIEVTGASRASGTSLMLETDPIHRVGFDGQFWLAWLIFPEAGCWDLTATAGEHTLRATVWVYPQECRREADEEIPALCEIPG